MPIYMKYDNGNIKGDVTADGFKDQVELHSFQWGTGRGISSPVGASADREASAPSVSEITVTKDQDKGSVKLINEALQGEGKNCLISFAKTDKGKLSTFLEFTLTNTMISSYSISSGGDRPTESLSLNFTKIEVKVTPMGAEGSGESPETVTYDLGAAKVV